MLSTQVHTSALYSPALVSTFRVCAEGMPRSGAAMLGARPAGQPPTISSVRGQSVPSGNKTTYELEPVAGLKGLSLVGGTKRSNSGQLRSREERREPGKRGGTPEGKAREGAIHLCSRRDVRVAGQREVGEGVLRPCPLGSPQWAAEVRRAAVRDKQLRVSQTNVCIMTRFSLELRPQGLGGDTAPLSQKNNFFLEKMNLFI